MRISGVRVGRVKKKAANPQTGLTDTELEIDARYAPIPKDTRAILRQKTLLGETYVELSPGPPGGEGRRRRQARCRTGGRHGAARRDPARVRPRDEGALLDLVRPGGRGGPGQREHLNDALALLTPFAEDTDEVLKVLRQQSGATQRFVRDTGYVFDALSERKGQLRDLIRNSNRTWEAIASRDAQLADTFRVFPTFLREGRATTQRLTKFADDTDPLITQLRPAAREISPTLIDLDALAPDLKGLFQDLDPLVKVSKRGLPATEQVLDNTRPLLRRIDPWLRNFTPIVDYLGLYRREIASFLANDAAATQGREQGFNDPTQFLHYLRAANPLSPDMMTGWPYRLAENRSNPYTEPAGTTSSGPRATSRSTASTSARTARCRRRLSRTSSCHRWSWTRSTCSSSAATRTAARRLRATRRRRSAARSASRDSSRAWNRCLSSFS